MWSVPVCVKLPLHTGQPALLPASSRAIPVGGISIVLHASVSSGAGYLGSFALSDAGT